MLYGPCNIQRQAWKLSAVQRATESHAARHSMHTPQPETHVATTVQHL
jgi:hypothetical protein